MRSLFIKISKQELQTIINKVHLKYNSLDKGELEKFLLSKIHVSGNLNEELLLEYKYLLYYLHTNYSLIIDLPKTDNLSVILDILSSKFFNIDEFLNIIKIFDSSYHIQGVNVFRLREETIPESVSKYSLYNYTNMLTLEGILHYPELFKYSINSKDLLRSWAVMLTSKKAFLYSPTIDYTKKAISNPKNVDNKTKFEILQRNLDLGVTSLTNIVLENKNYTFGMEIETSEGLVNEKDYENLNVTCVYDGSLKAPDGVAYGGEYVTGVLQGDAGINQVKRLVNTLIENNCKVNNLCSIHIHIGNANFNKENLLAMYKLGIILENELFSMMPLSRRNNVYCTNLETIFTAEDEALLASAFNNEEKNKLGLPSKDFQKKVIDYLFDLRLFNYVKMGKNFKSILKNLHEDKSKPSKNANKLTGHPQGNKCGYDKNAQRYSWLNFVTCLFNNKGIKAKTLEFRLHSGTLNFKKILSWLKICIAFTWFAENHQEAIFKGYYIDENGDKYNINLALILKLCYPNSHQVLINYVKERIELFNNAEAQDAEILEYQESLNLVKSFKLKDLIIT